MLFELRRLGARVGPWPRRALAAVCLALAALSAVHGSARPADTDSALVAVAARSLPVGHVLAARDVVVRRWPRSVAPPDGAHSAAALLGRRLASPVVGGEPVTSSRLVGRDLTDHLARGTVAVTLTLDDPRATELVSAGDHVDVVEAARDPSGTATRGGTDDAGATTGAAVPVASDVLVLTVLAPAAADPAGADTAGIIVAAPRDLGLRLARDGSSQIFAVVARSP